MNLCVACISWACMRRSARSTCAHTVVPFRMCTDDNCHLGLDGTLPAGTTVQVFRPTVHRLPGVRHQAPVLIRSSDTARRRTQRRTATDAVATVSSTAAIQTDDPSRCGGIIVGGESCCRRRCTKTLPTAEQCIASHTCIILYRSAVTRAMQLCGVRTASAGHDRGQKPFVGRVFIRGNAWYAPPLTTIAAD